MLRKRKQPTPSFKLPAPFQPITGERAPLRVEGVFPYVAMMQIAKEDTERDYVVCRGFDVRIGRFIDYAEGDESKPGIPVAKPFGRRYIGAYRVAEIYPAILPLQTSNPSPVTVKWRVGQNPGLSDSTPGQPASLTETVDFLQQGSIYINWMLVDEGDRLIECCLAEDHPGYGIVFTVRMMIWDIDNNGHKPNSANTDTYYAIDWRYGMPYPNAGARGLFVKRTGLYDGAYVDLYEVVSLDCESPPISCDAAEVAT